MSKECQDNNITTFEQVFEKQNVSAFAEDNIISIPAESAYPIYAWYESGVIKYYSESENIKANKNMSYMFSNLRALENIGDLASLDTTNVASMSFMFKDCITTTDLTPLTNWNVSKVTDMRLMFMGCTVLVDTLGLNNWDIMGVNTNNNGSMLMFSSAPSHPTFTKRAGTWDANGSFIPTA